MNKIKEFSEELVEEILSAKDDYRKSKAVEMLSTYIAGGIEPDEQETGALSHFRNQAKQRIRKNFGLEQS